MTRALGMWRPNAFGFNTPCDQGHMRRAEPFSAILAATGKPSRPRRFLRAVEIGRVEVHLLHASY